MTGCLARWDEQFTLWLNALHTPFTDAVMGFASDKAVWIPFYILVICFIIRRLGLKRSLVVLGAVALTVFACDQIADAVKDSVQRLRPCYNTSMLDGGLHILERRGGFFGFFSGHSANAFGVAVCLVAALKKGGIAASGKSSQAALQKGSQAALQKAGTGRRWAPFNAVMILWAAVVSLSRVFVGKHFFGDVLAGAAAGCLTGWLIGAAAGWLLRRLQ